jgi:hypothetical protein
MPDDSPELQNLLHATPPGGFLALPQAPGAQGGCWNAGKLTRYNAIHIDGRGQTLSANQSGELLTIASRTLNDGNQNPIALHWSEQIESGQDVFHVADNLNAFSPGAAVFAGLGTNPWDATQPDFGFISRVLANDGKTITLDNAPEWAPSGTNHFLNPISLVSGVTIENIHFDFSTPNDSVLWLSRLRNVVIRNISGRFAGTGIVLDSCDNVFIENVDVELIKTTSSAKCLGGYNCSNVGAWNVRASLPQGSDESVIIWEASSRHCHVSDLIVVNDPSNVKANRLHIAGGSRGCTFDRVGMANPGLVAGDGGSASDYQIHDLSLSGLVIDLPSETVHGELTIDGVTLGELAIYKNRIALDSQLMLPICRGIIRKLSVRFTAPVRTAIAPMPVATPPFAMIYDADNIQMGLNLGVGKWINQGVDYGSQRAVNSLGVAKFLRIDPAAGASVDLLIEYWPADLADQI